jgi:hypothetical protein
MCKHPAAMFIAVSIATSDNSERFAWTYPAAVICTPASMRDMRMRALGV